MFLHMEYRHFLPALYYEISEIPKVEAHINNITKPPKTKNTLKIDKISVKITKFPKNAVLFDFYLYIFQFFKDF